VTNQLTRLPQSLVTGRDRESFAHGKGSVRKLEGSSRINVPPKQPLSGIHRPPSVNKWQKKKKKAGSKRKLRLREKTEKQSAMPRLTGRDTAVCGHRTTSGGQNE